MNFEVSVQISEIVKSESEKKEPHSFWSKVLYDNDTLHYDNLRIIQIMSSRRKKAPAQARSFTGHGVWVTSLTSVMRTSYGMLSRITSVFMRSTVSRRSL